MAVHMMGNPARLDELKAIADEHGLSSDRGLCQAFGATYKGRPVGSIGHAGAFSFNVYKTITSGDGGMVVTDDEEVFKRCFRLPRPGAFAAADRRGNRQAALHRPRFPLHRIAGGRAAGPIAKAAADRQPPAGQQEDVTKRSSPSSPASNSASSPIPRGTARRC